MYLSVLMILSNAQLIVVLSNRNTHSSISPYFATNVRKKREAESGVYLTPPFPTPDLTLFRLRSEARQDIPNSAARPSAFDEIDREAP
jgi:hypothetical protein